MRESLEWANTLPARPSNKNIIKNSNFPAGFSFLIHAANLTQKTRTHYLISCVKLTNMYGVNMCSIIEEEFLNGIRKFISNRTCNYLL